MKHDIAFGYRTPKRITHELKSAQKALKTSSGFRAPALSYTSQLFYILDKLGFHYDSSIPDHVAKTCYPFKIPDTQLWELPLTTPQDSTLFRDMNLSDTEAYRILYEKLTYVKEHRGVAVLLFHPGIIQKHFACYERLLSHLRKDNDVWQCTPTNLIEYLTKDTPSQSKPLK